MAEIQSIDLPISTGLDQPIATHPVLDDIQVQLDQMIETRNPEIGFRLMEDAAVRQHVYGLILAKVVYTMYNNWALFGIDATFDEYVYQRFGKAQETIRRYLQVGELFHERVRHLNQDVLRILALRPMRDLIAIAQFSLKHRNPNEQEFRELALAGTTTEVRSLLERFAGREETKSRALKFFIQRNDGTLTASKGGHWIPIGFLRTSPEDMSDPVLKEAVDKLLLKIGAIER